MFNEGNLVWNADGSVWAVFRVPAGSLGQMGPAALASALGGLGCPAKLSSFDGSEGVTVEGGTPAEHAGTERPDRADDAERVFDHVDVHARGPRAERGSFLLSVEIAATGMRGAAYPVMRAAVAAVLRRFGLGTPRPGPRLAAVQRSAADLLVAGLAAFGLTEPGGEEVRWAIGGVVSGWSEVRGRGYAIGASGGRPRYRAWFAAMPLDDTTAGWPLGPAGLAAIDWCVCVRPSRSGVSAALLVLIGSGDLVGLGERGAALRRALRGQEWDLVRPSSGQLLLGAAMIPGAASPRLPGSLFFPLPHAGMATG
jgi:hypothetical protein